MKTKHTPGPWRMNNPYKVGPEVTAKGMRIAHLSDRIAYGTLYSEQAEANAILIAAAPPASSHLRFWHFAEQPDGREYRPIPKHTIPTMKHSITQ